jgi:hypothetical protein
MIEMGNLLPENEIFEKSRAMFTSFNKVNVTCYTRLVEDIRPLSEF